MYPLIRGASSHSLQTMYELVMTRNDSCTITGLRDSVNAWLRQAAMYAWRPMTQICDKDLCNVDLNTPDCVN